MAREHPVHAAVQALTRLQRQHIPIAETGVSYRVTAPCLLQQLHEAVALGTETGGRGVPGARANVSMDALDLWTEILHNTHTWADHLNLDRRPYLPHPDTDATPHRPTQQQTPAPWWHQLDPDAAAAILHDVPTHTDPQPATRRQVIAPPKPELPPVGRLLRLVAATATSRGLDPVADAIARNALRWHQRITELLGGTPEQRGIRGATCPEPGCGGLCITHLHPPALCRDRDCCERVGCGPGVIVEPGDDGQRAVRPAIVLTQREVAGEPLSWLTCQACGWTRSLAEPAELAQAAS